MSEISIAKSKEARWYSFYIPLKSQYTPAHFLGLVYFFYREIIVKRLVLAGLCIFFLSGLTLGLTACSTQENQSDPNLSSSHRASELPVFVNAPAMGIESIHSGPEIPQTIFIIARHGKILHRYDTDQTFDQMFMTGLENGFSSMKIPVNNLSPYLLTTTIDNLKIFHSSEIPGVDNLSGELQAHYFIKLNGILIWNRSFQSTANFSYQNPEDESRAVSGVLQFLINNNIAMFANQFSQDCTVKEDGVQC